MIRGNAKTIENRPADLRDFGVLDSRGRKVGAGVRVWIMEATRNESSAMIYPREGVFYTFDPFATRDGERYGASHARKQYDSEEELSAGIEAYFLASCKRALKR